MRQPTLVRTAIFLATVVATWGVFSLGSAASDSDLVVGQLAPRDYDAQSSADVEDVIETEKLRQEAREGVDDDQARQTQPEIESSVKASVNEVFDDFVLAVIGDPPDTPTTTIPELPTTTTTPPPADGSTTTTIARLPAQLTGRVFVDVDGDGVFDTESESNQADRGLARVSIQIRTEGEVSAVRTGPDGVWAAEIASGAAVVTVDASDPEIPEGFLVLTENLAQLIECDPADTCSTGEIAFGPNLRPIDDVTLEMAAQHPLPGDTVEYLATTASEDVVRAALEQPLHLNEVKKAALERVDAEFGRRIDPDQLQETKARQRTSPPLVFHADTGQDVAGGEAAGEIVATFLQANYLINEDRLTELQDAAALQVEPVMVTFVEGGNIVRENTILTQLDIDAIDATTTLVATDTASVGLFAVIAVLVALLGLYLSRFRSEFWARPRMTALLGILVLLAAGSVKLTQLVHESTSWYVLPAVAFGFVTAVLFDQRIGVLMALAVGVLTAVGTLDTGITVYAVLAALAPISFVSAISSRGAFRNAVVLSSMVAAGIAAATSWFFHAAANDAVVSIFGIEFPYQVIGVSIAWAFGVSVAASLLGLAALQFFESAFDITTTLSLLDLTDRNHEALQLLQAEAFGTFNHSLMVGTLADAAARAIGANPLLARSMAYYHDLGKTENPTYFIENQFGIANPHDFMDPKDSADMIRSHVSSGVALAKKFKIPTDVTQGIVSHHGDGVMRFFYEKARERYGDDVDIDDYRHIGHKPRTAETAIVMLSDSLEAACRAVFQTEEPSADAIEKVVDRVMDEKVEDGQLSESPLTLGELTKIRKAFLESLVGHYHQRIAYPNFPGT